MPRTTLATLVILLSAAALSAQQARPKAFDPADADKTLDWLASLGKRWYDARDTGNDLLANREKAVVEASVAALVGRKVQWTLTVSGITDEGISVKYLCTPKSADATFRVLDGDPFRKAPDGMFPAYMMEPGYASRRTQAFPAPAAPWVFALRPGDKVTVKGTVAFTKFEPMPSNRLYSIFRVYLAQTTVAPVEKP